MIKVFALYATIVVGFSILTLMRDGPVYTDIFLAMLIGITVFYWVGVGAAYCFTCRKACK